MVELKRRARLRSEGVSLRPHPSHAARERSRDSPFPFVISYSYRPFNTLPRQLISNTSDFLPRPFGSVLLALLPLAALRLVFEAHHDKISTHSQ